MKPWAVSYLYDIINLEFILVIFILLAKMGYSAMMNIGVTKDYQPEQPIAFSHKIHAGDNGIDCNYCHTSARYSKTSGIPSANVCMNCHEYISEYNGEEDLENGYTKDFYTNEIKKLYYAVGWDEENQIYTGNTKPVKWVRIHNLPVSYTHLTLPTNREV